MQRRAAVQLLFCKRRYCKERFRRSYMLFMVLCRKQFSPGQDKGTHKLGCACLATYVRGSVRRQNESREKGVSAFMSFAGLLARRFGVTLTGVNLFKATYNN